MKRSDYQLLLKLGWRNIWRNKRRTIITMLAVTFAVMLSIAMRGLQLGTYDVNIKYVVDLYTGYIQIQEKGFLNNPTLQKSFHVTEELRKIVQRHRDILASAPRVVGDGLVSFGENSLGAMVVGIVPDREQQVCSILTKLNRGQLFATDSSYDILIGHQLLENLKAQLGDRVVVLAQGFDGSLGNVRFRIVGTIKTGSPEFDAASIFMGLSTAQELLAMDGRVSVLALRLRSLQAIREVQPFLQEQLRGTDLSALAWNQVMPDFEQTIQLDNVSGILMLGILIVVVAFGITNTVLMSITERFKEFGVIRAIGMPRQSLVVLVFVETLMIVLIGIVVGNLLAAGVNYYIMENPIVFGGQYEQIYAEYGFLPRLESTLRPSMFLNSTLATVVISLLATIYPLAKVHRLKPLKGIRYT